jgi:hypothetical protein
MSVVKALDVVEECRPGLGMGPKRVPTQQFTSQGRKKGFGFVNAICYRHQSFPNRRPADLPGSRDQ